jgi:hypothetical protein
VAHLGIANLVGGEGQQGDLLLQQRRRLEVVVARQGADGDLVTTLLDVRQVGNPSDVDEHRRDGQPQLHERQKRMAAGQQLGLVAVLAEQRDCFVGRSQPARSRTQQGSRIGPGHHPRPTITAQARTALTML